MRNVIASPTRTVQSGKSYRKEMRVLIILLSYNKITKFGIRSYFQGKIILTFHRHRYLRHVYW